MNPKISLKVFIKNSDLTVKNILWRSFFMFQVIVCLEHQPNTSFLRTHDS